MQKTAREIAELLHGTVEGEKEVLLQNFAKIEEAGPGDLTFLSNPAYEAHLYLTRASAAIVANDFQPKSALPAQLTLLRVADPYAAFATLLQWASTKKALPHEIHATAVMGENTEVSSSCFIGPLVTIGKGVRIGDNCEIHSNTIIGEGCEIGNGTVVLPGVSIGEGTQIGTGCVIQSGAIIGTDGFGFAPQSNASYEKIPQLGNVIIGDRCEIGAGTTIDRATLGSTRIGNGVKLDNQIQVAHNVSIGDNTVIAAQTGIAGSTSIGSNCMIGGQVGFAGHISVADGVKIAAQSGVTKSIREPNGVWQGTPASLIKEHQIQLIELRKLVRNKALERISEIEKQLEG